LNNLEAFFLHGNGLNIMEPVQTGVEFAKIVNLAKRAAARRASSALQ
jgi:hypothetical protein